VISTKEAKEITEENKNKRIREDMMDKLEKLIKNTSEEGVGFMCISYYLTDEEIFYLRSLGYKYHTKNNILEWAYIYD
jgi:hypothetical protein